MKILASALALALFASIARGQGYAYEQPMFPNGGTSRMSQLWIDPAGQNDSDNDAIAWEDFEFPIDATIAKIRWNGAAALSLGFRIGFYDQDPTTTAVQPDLFTPGSTPIGERVYTSFSQTSLGNGLYRFELDLATPLPFAAHTRYFVSVVGRSPLYYEPWYWAQGTGGVHGTFWWQRGAHMFFHLGDDRAVSLATAEGWPIGEPSCSGDGSGAPCPCSNAGGPGEGCANSTGAGAVLAAFGHAQVGADTVVLTARQCPPNTPGLFFSGPNALAGSPFGDGLRCVGGGIVRLGVVTTSAGGVAASQTTLSVREGLTGGELRRYQYWFRDVPGPCSGGFNTTNALAIQW